MLTDGSTARSLVPQTRTSERQVLKCMKKFVSCITKELEDEWLPSTSDEELVGIEGRYRKLGFP